MHLQSPLSSLPRMSRRPLSLAWLGLSVWLWSAAFPVAAGGLSFAPPPTGMPMPPELAARAFILQDLSSHQTLAARHADQRVEPASLTKLM
ncbi:MAG: hypothetical protein KA781_09640, partial [Aquabacterium sp.]|nr:hypothetical protein [Aquabacterium sp.]